MKLHIKMKKEVKSLSLYHKDRRSFSLIILLIKKFVVIMISRKRKNVRTEKLRWGGVCYTFTENWKEIRRHQGELGMAQCKTMIH